jgi:hypothetical protein
VPSRVVVEKWDSVYFGANQDAIATAATMGIDAASSNRLTGQNSFAGQVCSGVEFLSIQINQFMGEDVPFNKIRTGRAKMFEISQCSIEPNLNDLKYT